MKYSFCLFAFLCLTVGTSVLADPGYANFDDLITKGKYTPLHDMKDTEEFLRRSNKYVELLRNMADQPLDAAYRKQAYRDIAELGRLDLRDDRTVDGWRNATLAESDLQIPSWKLQDFRNGKIETKDDEQGILQTASLVHEKEKIELRITYTPSHDQARFALGREFFNLGFSNLNTPFRRALELIAIKDSPGQQCFLPFPMQLKRPGKGWLYYWNDRHVIFFRENCLVELRHSWTATFAGIIDDVIAEKPRRGDIMKVARTVDEKLIALFDKRNEYRLVWQDEFERDGRPDPRNWNYEHGFVRNNELQWYQPENAICKDGQLVIESRKERKPNPNYRKGSGNWKQKRESIEYTSACLITKDLHAWQFGRFEVKARIKAKEGLWPAIWFLGVSGDWPSCGEIDLMEFYGGNILANACWGTSQRWRAKWDDLRKPVASFGDPNWDDKFHVWRMDWDSKHIRLYVDDLLLNEIDLSQTINLREWGPKNPFHQPHYLLLNLAIGGNNGGDPTGTPFPTLYEIEYVRVYQKETNK